MIMRAIIRIQMLSSLKRLQRQLPIIYPPFEASGSKAPTPKNGTASLASLLIYYEARQDWLRKRQCFLMCRRTFDIHIIILKLHPKGGAAQRNLKGYA